jgi:hypothetical protein
MMVDATSVVVTEKDHQHGVTAGASIATDHKHQMFLMPRMKKKSQLMQIKTLSH